MKLLNLGCGNVFHESWCNVDINSTSKHVLNYDLKKGIPFASESFDAVYNSHILEHIAPDHVPFFLEEIKRVLKPGGIIRIVVPDLEGIVRLYLGALESKKSDVYKWAIIELLDQLVRVRSGGRMREHLLSKNLQEKELISSRLGKEADAIWRGPDSLKNQRQWMSAKNFSKGLSMVTEFIAKSVLLILGGRKFKSAFEEGLFRQSGEIHRWMYDEFSLSCLLEESGFKNKKLQDAFTSQIPQFEKYSLDSVGKTVRKPDSLYMEATK